MILNPTFSDLVEGTISSLKSWSTELVCDTPSLASFPSDGAPMSEYVAEMAGLSTEGLPDPQPGSERTTSWLDVTEFGLEYAGEGDLDDIENVAEGWDVGRIEDVVVL